MSSLVEFVEWISKKKETLSRQFTLTLMKEVALFLNTPAPDREIMESKIVSMESNNLIIILALVKKEEK